MESQGLTSKVTEHDWVFWELMILFASEERNWIWSSVGTLPLHFEQKELIVNKHLNWYYFQIYSVPLVVG